MKWVTKLVTLQDGQDEMRVAIKYPIFPDEVKHPITSYFLGELKNKPVSEWDYKDKAAGDELAESLVTLRDALVTFAALLHRENPQLLREDEIQQFASAYAKFIAAYHAYEAVRDAPLPDEAKEADVDVVLRALEQEEEAKRQEMFQAMVSLLATIEQIPALFDCLIVGTGMQLGERPIVERLRQVAQSSARKSLMKSILQRAIEKHFSANQ